MLDEESNNLDADISFSGPFVLQGRILRFGACITVITRLKTRFKQATFLISFAEHSE